jgi:hypothetical protein
VDSKRQQQWLPGLPAWLLATPVRGRDATCLLRGKKQMPLQQPSPTGLGDQPP